MEQTQLYAEHQAKVEEQVTHFDTIIRALHEVNDHKCCDGHREY